MKNNEHFIKNIEIKDFKLFKDFKAEGFGRVNLIGGKNNVGKTAFMEACYINISSFSIDLMANAISFINFARYKLRYICRQISPLNLDMLDTQQNLEKTQILNINSNCKKSFFQVKKGEGQIEYEFIIDDKKTIINKNLLSYTLHPTTEKPTIFIDNFGYLDEDLELIYKLIQFLEAESIISKLIHDFEPDIKEFKVFSDGVARCKNKKNNFLDLNEFGDGIKKYISIICSINIARDGYLFIDEIENGIHYTNLDKLWEIILTVSKEQSVQVFATTHSKECIESYARVAKKLGDEDVKFLSLYKNKADELKSMTLNYQDIQDRIELGLDNR